LFLRNPEIILSPLIEYNLNEEISLVKIRLARGGRKKRPFYRVVAADSRMTRDGRFLEVVGTYNPLSVPKEIKINLERVNYWLENGAQLSETVTNLVKMAKAKVEA